MKRKIHFLVTVASRFIKDSIYKMDIPFGDEIYYTDLLIEYEQTLTDPLPEAYIALAKWMKENHPGKDYRTYYWTLEFT